MRNWTDIDQQAMDCGIAECRLKQYQDKHNHKAILYNTVARYNQIPAITIKTRRIPIKRITKLKRKVSVFSLDG